MDKLYLFLHLLAVVCLAFAYRECVMERRRARQVRRVEEGVSPCDFYLFDPPSMPAPRIRYPRYENDGEGFKDGG